MRLSKIYSNDDSVFEPVRFHQGLNIVIAEIRLPENKLKDTHNLGKTTLSKLIDFCLLRKRDKKNFLFKKQDIFQNFIFYLEIETNQHGYITIKRTVNESSKISFKIHSESDQDFSEISGSLWDHSDISFEKAKQLLDGILELNIISPFSYRTALGYFLRIQDDYGDVFVLNKFRGQHTDWKPYLAQLIGFDSTPVIRNYEIIKEIEVKKHEVFRKKRDLLGIADEKDKLEGLILIKLTQVSKIEAELDRYDFRISDYDINEDLVNSIETKIAALNEQRYYLTMSQHRIEDSLKNDFSFDLETAQQVFSEANIYFNGQLKKDFEDLLEFNRAITEERTKYLRQEMEKILYEKKEIETELGILNQQRSQSLAILKEKESFLKYKKMTIRLSELKADLELLTRQKKALTEVKELEKKIDELKHDSKLLKEKITDNIAESNKRYKNIRLYFNDIIKRILDKDAVISTKVNEKGNIEYSAEILNESGEETAESSGHTYKKLLCIAFDMAVLREYINDDFIHFVYHDDIFDSLDDRKKENLIAIMREYSEYGIQQIATMIDSSLPIDHKGDRYRFKEYEIVKFLHDEGADGRLFKMPIW